MSIPIRWQMEDLINEHRPSHRHAASPTVPICDACKIIDRSSSVLHGHQHFLLTLIIRGTGIQTLNGIDIPFAPGDLFLLSPSDFHSNTVCPGESFDYYRLCFSYELLEGRLTSLFAANRLPLHLHLSQDTALLAERILAQLTDESENGQDRIGHKEYLQAMVEQLLILILRQLPGSGVPQLTTPINRALSYLHAHFHEPINVGDVASIAGYTPNYFNYCFHNQIGVPLGEYLRQMRLAYAENLLRASAMSVTEIAYASGFGSSSHFSRIFRDKYGCSPQKYRQEIHNR